MRLNQIAQEDMLMPSGGESQEISTQDLQQRAEILHQRYQELFGQDLDEHAGTDWSALVDQLKHKLLKGQDWDYDGIDRLMRTLCNEHSADVHELHDQFVHMTGVTPDEWIRSQLSAT